MKLHRLKFSWGGGGGGMTSAPYVHRTVAQYSEWTVGSLSSVTCAPMFMQFTGCHQPVQGFYWPENAIDWLRKC